MGNILKFAAVNAKVKALEGQLLTKKQYEELIQTKDYKEVIRYLKEQTNYSKALKGYDISEVNRGQLELILKKYYINNFLKLSHYFNREYKKLFEILFIKFEIEDLKIILRGKYVGEDSKYIHSIVTYESPLSHLDYDRLIAAKDINGAIEALSGTIYYKHLYPLLNNIDEDGLFRIEMTLDFAYYSALRKLTKKIDKEDSDIIKKIIGTYADLLNIQWIFRGKRFYNLNPEELYNYTIYDGYKIKREVLKDLCYAKTAEEFHSIIENIPYKEVFDKRKSSAYLVEKEMLTYLKNIYMHYKKENKMNISVVIAYFELALIEIRDIVSIIENKRYKLSNEEAAEYIITDI